MANWWDTPLDPGPGGPSGINPDGTPAASGPGTAFGGRDWSGMSASPATWGGFGTDRGQQATRTAAVAATGGKPMADIPSNPNSNPGPPTGYVVPTTPTPTTNSAGVTSFPPTNPAQAGTLPTGISGYNQALMMRSPDAAKAYLLQQMGLTPGQHGMLADFISSYYPSLMQPWLETQGLGKAGGVGDNYANLIQQFAQRAAGPGFFGGLNNDVQSALGGAAGKYLSSLGADPKAIQYLQMMNALSNAGSNPLMAASSQQGLSDAFGNYALNEATGPNNASGPFWDYLNKSKYNTGYGLFGH